MLYLTTRKDFVNFVLQADGLVLDKEDTEMFLFHYILDKPIPEMTKLECHVRLSRIGKARFTRRVHREALDNLEKRITERLNSFIN